MSEKKINQKTLNGNLKNSDEKPSNKTTSEKSFTPGNFEKKPKTSGLKKLVFPEFNAPQSPKKVIGVFVFIVFHFLIFIFYQHL